MPARKTKGMAAADPGTEVRAEELAAADSVAAATVVEAPEGAADVTHGEDEAASAATYSALSEAAACAGSPPTGASCAPLPRDCCASIRRRSLARSASTASSSCARATPTLSAEDVALGYKQLLEVERAWRDMKTTLDLRPVYHRKETRIRAHVLLCWLGLLLIRIAENATGETWRTIRTELDKLHLGRFAGPAGEASQRTETTPVRPRSSRPQASPSRPASSVWRRPNPPRPPDPVTYHAPPTRPIGIRASSSCGIPAYGRPPRRSEIQSPGLHVRRAVHLRPSPRERGLTSASDRLQ